MRDTAEVRREVVREVLRSHLTQPEERKRLFRFCRRLTGDGEVAEDLTQDALLEAWRQADSLHNPAVWRSWLHGIARNMYLRWHRSHGREMARRIAPPDGNASTLLEARPDESMDLHTSLERYEIAQLLGRALGKLPGNSRQLLVLHYLEDLPHQEIAAQLGVTENAAAVRLHRGKAQLRRVLNEDLRPDAAAYGLVSPQSEDSAPSEAVLPSQETHLWCPFCGKARLRSVKLGDRSRFSCMNCHFVMGPRIINYPSDCIFGHHNFDPSTVTSGVNGFKPALNRMVDFYRGYLTAGRETGKVRCIGCGKPLTLSTECPAHLSPRPHAGFHVNCSHCKKIHVLLPTAFAFTAKPVQDFWKQNPRMRLASGKSIPGQNAFVTSFESVTSCSRIDLIFNGEDYRIVETHAD